MKTLIDARQALLNLHMANKININDPIQRAEFMQDDLDTLTEFLNDVDRLPKGAPVDENDVDKLRIYAKYLLNEKEERERMLDRAIELLKIYGKKDGNCIIKGKCGENYYYNDAHCTFCWRLYLGHFCK